MASEGTNVTSERSPRKVRKNGWTFPLHPLQFMAWFFFFYFLFTLFTLFIPNLPASCDRVLCYTFGSIIFLVHFIIHIQSVSTNPADDGVTAKYDARRGSRIFPLGTFDRSKHEHVIENQFCYICEVSVTPKSKHCSVCNKCVQSFDHHCKWLNNCVGAKNYRLFMACVVSAILGSLFVFAVSITLVVSFFSPYTTSETRGTNNFSNGTMAGLNGTTNENSFVLFTSFGSSSDASDHHVWISVVILTALLSTISFLLLGHLLLFHIYLYHNKMTTYDFIMKRRREQTEMEDNNNEKNNEKRALLSTSYFFACCSTKIERMKRSRKVHDESKCKNVRAKKKKWFKRNITAVKRGSGKKKSESCEKEIENIDGTIRALPPATDGNNGLKRSSINTLPIWNTHGDVYLGSPERRVLESQISPNVEPEQRTGYMEPFRAPLNKRFSNLSLQTSASDPFTSGPCSIEMIGHENDDGPNYKRRASETPATCQRNFFNEQSTLGQLSQNGRLISSNDRNQLMSRLCDKSKPNQMDNSIVHKRMKRDPKVQNHLLFRQKSIEQMINTQKLFHQLPGISLDSVKTGGSNSPGSIVEDPGTCDDNGENSMVSDRV